MISSVTQLQHILETDYGMHQVKSLTEIKRKETFEYKVEGNMVTIFLPETYAKKDRRAFLREDFSREFASHKPQFEQTVKYSSAGHVTFPGGSVKVVAKTKSAGAAGTPNKGIEFENNLVRDLNKVKEDKVGFTYPSFIEQFTRDIKSPITTVTPTGAANSKRPLIVQGNQLYVSVGGQVSEKVGSVIADVKLKTTTQRDINLSLKFDSTVAFFGSGIATAFPRESFIKGRLESPIGESILETFGIDQGQFFTTFMSYSGSSFSKKTSKAPKASVTPRINKQRLERFIRSMIGYDYHLVHGFSNGFVYSLNMTPSFLTRAAHPTTDLVVKYPIGGSAKRIDMFVSTEVFDLNFNIRAKDAGVFPTHLVCNYKTKHGFHK